MDAWLLFLQYFCVFRSAEACGKNQNTMLSGIINLRVKTNIVKLPDFNELFLKKTVIVDEMRVNLINGKLDEGHVKDAIRVGVTDDKIAPIDVNNYENKL